MTGKIPTCGEELIQLKTKSTIEIIVMLIEEKTEKIWKQIELELTKINVVADMVTSSRD